MWAEQVDFQKTVVTGASVVIPTLGIVVAITLLNTKC